MEAKREYRNRDPVEVAVLDALVDRGENGMTVFELRSRVDDVDINDLETALSELKDDDLISVTTTDGRTRIKPDERIIPSPTEGDDEQSLIDRVRERLPL